MDLYAFKSTFFINTVLAYTFMWAWDFLCSTQWPLLLVCQVCWRWCQPCCSWGTWLSRRSVVLTRPQCRMTLVHIFRQTIISSAHACLSHSICSKLSNSFVIPPSWHHLFYPLAAQKVSHLLSINVTEFTRAILSPRIKVCITIIISKIQFKRNMKYLFLCNANFYLLSDILCLIKTWTHITDPLFHFSTDFVTSFQTFFFYCPWAVPLQPWI